MPLESARQPGLVTWLEPRSIRAKVMLLVLASALPLFLTSMYFMVNGIDKEIEFARTEMHGNAYQRPLEALLDKIATSEKFLIERASNPIQSIEQKSLALEIETEWRALDSVQTLFGKELQFTHEGLKKRRREHLEVAVVHQEWRVLQNAGSQSAAAIALQHRHLASDLREMIQHSGDTSNLILDPDLDSYYLMDATLQALPQTQERLAAIASQLRALPSSRILPPSTRTALALFKAFLQESDQNRISGDLNTSLNEDAGFNGISETLQANLPPAEKLYVDANQQLIVLIERTLESADAKTLSAIADAADRARQASFQLWWVAEPELDRLLEARITDRAHSKSLGILFMGCAVLLSGTLALLIVHRITKPITELSDVASRISKERDYSVRAPVSTQGETGALIASFNDMLSQIESHELARKAAQDLLLESEERYSIAAHGANDGLWDWKLIANTIYFSPRWNQMLGYPDDRAWPDPEEWFRRIHKSDRERVKSELDAHREGRKREFVTEYRMGHQNGGYIWILSRGIATRDENGVAHRIAGSHTDITEGKIADALTGLPNRLYFLDKLESAIEAASQAGSCFAVMFLDVDKFKSVNDTLGHKGGDDLLVGIAARLVESVHGQAPSEERSRDVIVARLGGDEFAVLLNNLDSEQDAQVVAGRILKSLAAPFELDGRHVNATISIGIAASGTAATAEDMLKNADTAMYDAKANGKARFAVFDKKMSKRATERLETETNLRLAIKKGELVLFYQPEISLSNGAVIGYEALVRWNHPQRGMLAPGEFISIAEESDLIVSLGRWVLGEACRQMAEWQKTYFIDPQLTVSVNISPKELSDSRLVDYVESVLAITGLDPRSLKLEMTESSTMQDPEVTIAILHRLKLMNIGLEIDDFGTGYSSLSYLRRFPFDAVKIDRSFVNDLVTSGGDLKIVGAIISLAHSLGLRVVAEGVETLNQANALTCLGCDDVQGFYYSKPRSANETVAFIKERSDKERRNQMNSPNTADFELEVLAG